jgi:hypothetical protein
VKFEFPSGTGFVPGETTRADGCDNVWQFDFFGESALP